MSETDWQITLNFILQQEGGYSDDPHDAGGITNLGITLKEYEVWVGQAVNPEIMKTLTAADVTPIYHANYWSASRCALLQKGVDLMVCDAAVNTGVHQSIKFLQNATNAFVDGIFGPITLAHVLQNDAKKLINRLADIRLGFYESLPSYRYFGNGWSKRVGDARETALGLAAGG